MNKKSEAEEQDFCYSVAHFVNIIAQHREDSQFGTSRRQIQPQGITSQCTLSAGPKLG